MRTLLVSALLLTLALPSLAQGRMDVIVDFEGVHRSGTDRPTFAPGQTTFEPTFENGGGIGGGINWYLSDRVSLEAKVAGLETRGRVRTIGSDYFAIADVGYAQLYPITLLAQWHMLEHGAIRPYIGAGVGHIILRNINRQVSGPGGVKGVKFDDPTGLVLDGALEWRLSKRWALTGDVRYIPIESKSRASFVGTTSTVEIKVKPLIVGTGLAYRF